MNLSISEGWGEAGTNPCCMGIPGGGGGGGGGGRGGVCTGIFSGLGVLRDCIKSQQPITYEVYNEPKILRLFQISEEQIMCPLYCAERIFSAT